MLRDVAHDRSSAVLHRQVLHRDCALVAVAVAAQGFDLRGEGAGQPGNARVTLSCCGRLSVQARRQAQRIVAT